MQRNAVGLSDMPSGLTQSQEQLLAYSNWGTLPSGQPLRALAGTTGLVPAAVTLCIFQVPNSRSRQRRVPFPAVCLLLLILWSVTKSTQRAAQQHQLASTDQIAKILHRNLQNGDSPAALLATSSQAMPSAQQQQHQQQHEQHEQHQRQQDLLSPAVLKALTDGTLDSMLQAAEAADVDSNDAWWSGLAVLVLPLLVGLVIRQAPVISVQAQWRHHRSGAGLAAAVSFGLLLCVAAPVTAEISTCAAVKTVCPAKLAAAPKPPAAPAAAAVQPSRPTPRSSGSPSPAPPSPPPPQPSYTDTLLAAMGARKEALHIASTPDSVPQRVDPVPKIPQLPRAVEEQMYSKLLAVLMGTANGSTSIGGGGVGQGNATSVPAKPGKPDTQLPQNATNPAQPVGGPLYLNNARLRVGMDPSKGGSLTWLSSPVMPPEWADVNLINTWDSGRLIQQSYYGCDDGSCWSDKPWTWNPVQGGSWHNQPPKVLFSSSIGGVMSTSSIPRNWGSQGLVDDMTMLTEARLMGSVVKVRFTMRYTGSVPHPPRHQEVPAVFVDRRLNVLATYTGNAPWTGGQLTFVMPGQTGQYYKPTERWAAYVDAKSGFGLGIYTPISDQLVAYRIGPESSTAKNDCSYLAPLITDAIQPDTEFSYESYIAIGRVDEMRKWFADIAATLQPNLAAQRRISSPTSYATSAAPADSVSRARNLAQMTKSGTTGTSSKRTSSRSGHRSGQNAASTEAVATSGSVLDTFFPVPHTPTTVTVYSDSFSNKIRKAAEHLLMPVRRFPDLDNFPVALPPMPVKVTIG